MEIEKLIESSQELMLHKDIISKVYFYSAGCGTVKADMKMKDVFESFFKSVKSINIHGDIAAAVHATTQNPGIVCILGTGSNCCFYDGEHIYLKNPSLGYLLGDEGSGNALGREVLKSYYLKTMPENLRVQFEREYQTDLDLVLEQLYQRPNPNRYLATFAKFVFQHRNESFVENLLHENISKFISSCLYAYKKELDRYPVHFVGSIAYYSQDIIKKILLEHGYIPGHFIKKPIENIINFIKDN
ncbi:N-acetylglucosamine kinase [Gramella sp. AN32]|uniref:N-acetylglucosamine kinase n=1 Tax=Christiangramia antarctica TaxID=2058158 RepID=A0ABW5X487_9FLAO|nr:N-acetylglucosamine kinase [Gramella sp. AN32]